MAGAAIVLAALAAYPIASLFAGHRYPAAPTFGLPCPTTIYTFGILLLATPPVRAALWIAPVAWAAVGSAGAVTLGMHEDLMLPLALLLVIGLSVRTSPRPQKR